VSLQRDTPGGAGRRFKNSVSAPSITSKIELDQFGELTEETEKQLFEVIFKTIVPILNENEADLL
jgi:hypothetical protein